MKRGEELKGKRLVSEVVSGVQTPQMFYLWSSNYDAVVKSSWGKEPVSAGFGHRFIPLETRRFSLFSILPWGNC